MGEIATWSAVKTKVGLGKDSNECPTKAELLALSPTGTGESYIGLEISNASSYGDNETIQLSDIHKVTYKYTLALTHKTLNFTALGGAPTPAGFDLVTQKQKYLDGVAQSGVIPVSYNLSAHPDWIYSENGLKATENLNTQERYGSVTFTQAESGKSIDGAVSQAAASQRFEYTFSSKNPGINFNALGGISSANKILDITSTRQEYRNNHTYGNLVQISFTNTGLPSWLINTNESWSAQENKSLSSRSHSMTYTQNESGKKFTVTFNQAAGTQTYGDITINPTSGIADIPAAGGTSGVFTYSYSQPWGWNGKTNDGGTITSGATASWSNAISGSNLGTTQKARTRLGSRTLTLSQNGKSASKSVDVYQAANQIVNVTQGAWVVSISANPSTLTEMGGTSQISASARAPRTNHWSSGATNAASDATGTPTLSIPTASTGFSLSGTTLTVAENKTANQRSVVVRATMDTVYKEVTVTQSAYLVEWRYTLTTSTPTLNFDALGTTKSGTISSYREKYINGSLVEGSHEGVNIQVKSTSAEIQSATAAVAITMKENTTTQARTGTVVYEQVGSGKTVTITCNQAAGTVSYNYYIGFNGNPNVGGYSMNWGYTQLGSSNGQSIDLKCWRKPVINGIESDTEEAAEYEVIFSGVGIDSFTVTNTPLSYDPTITTVRAYPKSINGSVFDLKGTVQYRIADYPSKSAYLYLTHKPVATVKRWTFQWYDQVESVTMKNVSHDSSAGSISPITIISKCEYLLASNQSQVAYTEYIKPNEDEDTATPVSWGRLVENGQTAQNNYDYAYLVDENKEDYDRQATRTFTQPGNPSNKRLYLYVTQTKPVTIKQEFHAELGNYYSYGDSNQIPLIYQWYSPDSSDTIDIGDMTPGGYTGVWCNLPATGVINCMITGKPQTGKPMKARLSNLQARTIEDFDSSSPTETNKGLSVGYSRQDYQIGIGYSPGMNNYFLITPSILSEAGDYGGGIRLEVSLRSSYSSNGTIIATVTLTPKNSDHPTIYFEVIYG